VPCCDLGPGTARVSKQFESSWQGKQESQLVLPGLDNKSTVPIGPIGNIILPFESTFQRCFEAFQDKHAAKNLTRSPTTTWCECLSSTTTSAVVTAGTSAGASAGASACASAGASTDSSAGALGGDSNVGSGSTSAVSSVATFLGSGGSCASRMQSTQSMQAVSAISGLALPDYLI
jgi:hypothetical protein